MCSRVVGFIARRTLFSVPQRGPLTKSEATKAIQSPNSSDSANNRAYSLCLNIPGVEEMEDVGALLACVSRPPDVLLLDGGKVKVSLM